MQSRRAVIASGITMAGATTAGCVSWLQDSVPTVRAELNMPDGFETRVENDQGRPKAIHVTYGTEAEGGPDIWWYNHEVDSVELSTRYIIGGHTVWKFVFESDDGAMSFDHQPSFEVFEDTPMTPEDFAVDEPGETQEFPLEVGIHAEIADAQTGDFIAQTEEFVKGVVIVTNTSDEDDNGNDDDNGDDDGDDGDEPQVEIAWQVFVEAEG